MSMMVYPIPDVDERLVPSREMGWYSSEPNACCSRRSKEIYQRRDRVERLKLTVLSVKRRRTVCKPGVL